MRKFSLKVLFLVFLVLVIQSHGESVNEKAIDFIKSYMDFDENPCEDFYSYACGKWSESHQSGRYSESTGLLDHKLNKLLLKLFKQTLANKNENDNDVLMQKVLTYFKSCRRDRKQRNIRYLKYAKPASRLNWPLLSKLEGVTWPKKKFDWLLTVANLRKFGLNNALMEQIIIENSTNSREYVIDLDKPNLKGKELPSLRKATGALLKMRLRESDVHAMVKDVKEFERKLLELVEIDDEYGVLAVTVNEMEEDFKTWSWRNYFEILLGQPVHGDYVFQIQNYAYFVELSKVLEETDAEIVCNYLMFKFLVYLRIDRSASADKVDCMVDVRSKMDLALNFIYATKFYSENAEIYNKDVELLLKIIRDEFRKKLYENRLKLKDEQREFLETKLNTMDLNMGNMPKSIDKQFVENYYKGIVLNPRDYYKNHLTLLQLRFEKERDVIVKGIPNKEDYFFIADSDTARSSTPFYLVRRNIIVIPYGLLQTPIYHHNMSDVLKYSLFGFNVAHEIAHGFDATGVVFDLEGTVQDIGTNIIENEEFNASLQCMQMRDETTSLDERVADFVGLRLAYDAYFKSNATNFEKDSILTKNIKHFEEKKLEKIFFLNFAQFFCGNNAAEFLDHDSDNIRLQQTLLNFEPFAEVFQCDSGSTMNPEVKCRLW